MFYSFLFSIFLLQIFSASTEAEVGKISKQWSGFAKELFTDADNFGVSCKCLFKKVL